MIKGAPKMPSPILVGKQLYVINDGGILTCVNAISGDVEWRERIGGEFSASPTMANGLIYLSNREGKTTVIKPDNKLNIVAENNWMALHIWRQSHPTKILFAQIRKRTLPDRKVENRLELLFSKARKDIPCWLLRKGCQPAIELLSQVIDYFDFFFGKILFFKRISFKIKQLEICEITAKAKFPLLINHHITPNDQVLTHEPAKCGDSPKSGLLFLIPLFS